MFKALMVPVLATGLAFGGPAQKAEALTGEEIAAIAAGLIIVGAIASSSNNRSSSNAVTRTSPVRNTGNKIRDFERRRVLPENCVRRFETDRGTRNLAMEPCLRRTGFDVKRLPDRCEVQVRTNRGLRDGFRRRCLEKAGYRFRDINANRGRVILDARNNR